MSEANILELIKTVDTAVKIGLGVLISGLTAYYTTKYNNKQEMIRLEKSNQHNKNKELFNHKISIFTDAAKSTEEYFILVQSFLSQLHRMGQLHQGILTTHDQIEITILKDFEKRWKTVDDARSTALYAYNILDIEKLGEIFQEHYSMFIKMRNDIFIEKCEIPSKEKMQSFIKELRNIRILFYKEASNSFNNLK